MWCAYEGLCVFGVDVEVKVCVLESWEESILVMYLLLELNDVVFEV